MPMLLLYRTIQLLAMRTRKGTIPWFKTDARCIECSSVVFVFSCNDNAALLKNITDLKKTCKDPLLSASLFQRKWKQILNILHKHFGPSFGEIKD